VIDLHLVRSSLDKIDGAFELFNKGRASTFILSVNVRAQADGLWGIQDAAAAALTGLADQIQAVPNGPKAKEPIRELEGRYKAWRKDTLEVLEKEAKESDKAAEAGKGAAREALLREAKGQTAAPADDAAAKKAAAEIEALGAGPADPEGTEMSMDEIQRILADAKKKL
jgi:hypothetical protein